MLKPWCWINKMQSYSMASILKGFARKFPAKLLKSPSTTQASPLGVYQRVPSSTQAMTAEFLKHYASLPNLPVPKLEQTLDKYLRTVKPLLPAEEFAITEQVAKDFGAPGGVGQKLQSLLEEKGAKEPNWLSQWWLDCAYLAYRLPVVVHSNPALVFPKQNFSSVGEQLNYAAKLIVGALHYKAVIDGAKLPQDFLGKSPLDMSQYKKVFNGCRIPGIKKDDIRHCAESKHIVVAHNNHFYKMQAYTSDGGIACEADIVGALCDIVHKSSDASAEAVGYLTTENRDGWGIAYENLMQDPTNCASLKTIEESMFVMCLDKPNRLANDASPNTRWALQLLHGYGSDNNSGNRWFDKTLQLIVGMDGVNGLCYEHSPTEGPPIANLADYIVSHAQKENVLSDAGRSALATERLAFNLSSELRGAIETAKQNIDLLVRDLDMYSFTFDKFGKEDIKALKFSPDSFIQIAIQMAYMRMHGNPTAHYESGSTRKFTGGRTETIRTCLPEIVDFASLHLKSDKQSSPTKYKSLQAAMKAHKDYVQSAIDGQAIDRHLLGLKMIAIENGMDVPVFYLDPGYSKSNHWRCSTSQVAAVHDMVMCYGPVVPDGYGCCYNPRRDAINFAVSAFNSNPTTCARKFGEALEASLVEIRDIAVSNMPSNL